MALHAIINQRLWYGVNMENWTPHRVLLPAVTRTIRIQWHIVWEGVMGITIKLLVSVP